MAECIIYLKDEKRKYIKESQIEMKTLSEYNIIPGMDKIKKKLKHAGKIKTALHKHVTKLVVQIKIKEKEMMAMIDEWVKPFADEEKRLHSRIANKPLIQELEKSAEEGLRGGIEHLIITAAPCFFKSFLFS